MWLLLPKQLRHRYQRNTFLQILLLECQRLIILMVRIGLFVIIFYLPLSYWIYFHHSSYVIYLFKSVGMADYQHVVAVHGDVARRKKRGWAEQEAPLGDGCYMNFLSFLMNVGYLFIHFCNDRSCQFHRCGSGRFDGFGAPAFLT